MSQDEEIKLRKTNLVEKDSLGMKFQNRFEKSMLIIVCKDHIINSE